MQSRECFLSHIYVAERREKKMEREREKKAHRKCGRVIELQCGMKRKLCNDIITAREKNCRRRMKKLKFTVQVRLQHIHLLMISIIFL